MRRSYFKLLQIRSLFSPLETEGDIGSNEAINGGRRRQVVSGIVGANRTLIRG